MKNDLMEAGKYVASNFSVSIIPTFFAWVAIQLHIQGDILASFLFLLMAFSFARAGGK